MSYSLPKILIIILIQVAIALIHVFRLGQIFQGQAYNLYYSYFSDLVLPFGAYFLLSSNEITFPVFQKWYVKAALIFGFTTFAEICQFFGIDFLGVTFDPFDILMYAMGV
jgi:hydrogenase maturation factor